MKFKRTKRAGESSVTEKFEFTTFEDFMDFYIFNIGLAEEQALYEDELATKVGKESTKH